MSRRQEGGADRDARLRLLLDSIVDYGIFTLGPDGHVDSWNAGAERINGYSAEDIVGQHFSRFYTEEDLQAGKPDMELAVATSTGRFEDESWRVRKDGSRFWANVTITALRGPDGRLIGFGKVTRDLTDRKRGEDALRDSEERLRLMVESVADYAILRLDAEGRVASWNLGAQRLKGYRADEIIGQHFSRFYPEEDIRSGKPEMELDVAAAEGRVEDEGWRLRKDGTRFWANVVITALRDQDGTLRGFAKVTRDLTERRQAQEALRGILERERETSEKLRELDQLRTDLVAIVAHDLRSPLATIAGFAEFLRSDWESTAADQRDDFLRRIATITAGLVTLVEDLIQVTRIEAGQQEFLASPVDVGNAVLETVRGLAPADRGRITAAVDDTVPLALGDERKLYRVLANLVSNALKFSPPDSPIEVGVVRGQDGVLVTVRDRGPGIRPEDHDRLFKRFSRLPGQELSGVGGTGLGLYIARSFVEGQQGHIWVEDAEGGGAMFAFTLPIAPG